MTLLFDENFPPTLPEGLRLLGYDAHHALEQLPKSTADVDVFSFLRDRGWAWVTHDKGVKRKKHERAALIAAGVGAFFLTGTVQRSPKEMWIFVLQVIDEMVRLGDRTTPPFIFGISDRRKFERLR